MNLLKSWLQKPKHQPSNKGILLGVIAIGLGLWLALAPGTIPITFGFSTHPDNCLPVRTALLVKITPTHIDRDDYVLFKPFGALLNSNDPWVIKRVKGVPGDHLEIHGGIVRINGQMQSEGMPSAPLFHKSIAEFDKDEVIPKGKYFVMGTHPYSLDSRYWGYLNQQQIEGKAYPII